MFLGGLTEIEAATPEIQEIVDEVKPQYEEKTNEKYEQFQAVSYKQQIVEGRVYYVKVALGNERYSHLKIYRYLPHRNKPLELLKFQTGKTKDDEVTSF